MENTRRGTAIAALAVASALWGTIGLAAAHASPDIAASAIGAAGMGLGGLLLFAILPRAALGVLRDPVARRWVLLGAIGVVVYPIALYPSMRLAGVALANVVALASGPVFAALAEWVIDRRRPSAVWAVGVSVAIGGTILLALGRGEEIGAGRSVTGVLLALASGAGYGWYAYASGRAIRCGHPSTPVMGAMFGAAGVVLVPFALALGGTGLASWPTAGIILYLAVGPLALAYWLFGIGLRALPASTVTVVTMLEPIVATCLAVLVLREALGVAGWLGIAAILSAVTLIGLTGPRPRPSPRPNPRARSGPPPSAD